MSQKKGNFVIMNSAGTVKMKGLATLTNDVTSAGYSDNTVITEHQDAIGVPRTLTKNFHDYSLSFSLTPGVGSALVSEAAVAAAIASIAKGDIFVSTGFTDDDYNMASGECYISEIGKTMTQGAIMTMNVTVRKVTDASGTGVDFATGAWA